jgi:2-iminoacetate synthase ThiH
MMCLRSLAQERPPAARRRFSRSAISRSCGTAAREALDALGYETTIDYLQAMCALVLRGTGLRPHANPGVMSRPEMAGLRTVSASLGVMLRDLHRRFGHVQEVIVQNFRAKADTLDSEVARPVNRVAGAL